MFALSDKAASKSIVKNLGFGIFEFISQLIYVVIINNEYMRNQIR